MRILTVANDLVPFGGLERAQLDIARALAERGHRIDLVHTREGSLTADWDSCATTRTRVASTRILPREPIRSVRTVTGLRQAIRTVEPDVVYVHHYRHLHPLLPALRGGKVPVVLHLHSSAPTRLGSLGRRTARLPSRVIAVSSHTADAWHPFFDDIVVVHNGIDLDGLRSASSEERRAARSRLGLEPDWFVAGFAGRLSPEKGLEPLLAAWADLDLNGTNRRLLVAGEGTSEYERQLRSLASEHVIFLGFCSDLTDVYAAADAMVVPSVWPDPCPRAVIEATAAGNPVIASAIGGIPELLPPEPGGFAVEPGDVVGIAAQLTELAKRPDELPERRVTARAHAEECFDLGAAVDRIADVLEEAVRGGMPRIAHP